MNEYNVGVVLNNGLTVDLVIEADNKTEADKKAKQTVEERGLTPDHIDYCDYIG